MTQQDLQGKTALVTGGTSGIGQVTAIELARRGAHVVVVGRDRERGGQALEEIKSASGSTAVEGLFVDLASQREVRELAARFLATHDRLHILVNNAGIVTRSRRLTVDGRESTFAVNFLAPFLLTHLLLPVLRRSAPARIVNVAAATERLGRIHFDDLDGSKRYTGLRAYNQSKLAITVFTYELARRLAGTGVTATVADPFIVRSPFTASSDVPLLFKLVRPFLVSPSMGARSLIHAAASPRLEGVTGKYFLFSFAVPSSRKSHNRRTAERLWQVVEDLTEGADGVTTPGESHSMNRPSAPNQMITEKEVLS